MAADEIKLKPPIKILLVGIPVNEQECTRVWTAALVFGNHMALSYYGKATK